MSQGEIFIRPGYNNIITLTSSKINADDSLTSISKEERKCSFPEENFDSLYFNNYSFSNCKFECLLSYAKSEVYIKYGTICQPWFFPLQNDSTINCDPWISKAFFQIMSKIPDTECSHCLPDCSLTFYESTVNILPFDTCGASQLGVRRFCKLNLKIESPTTDYLANQFIKDSVHVLPRDWACIPNYLLEFFYGIKNYGYNIFKETNTTVYNPYDRDIAMEEIIYKKSTIVELQSQIYMTWIDYFSAVGGLMGLVLGMGFFSIFELIWLCLRIGSKKFNFTKYIE